MIEIRNEMIKKILERSLGSLNLLQEMCEMQDEHNFIDLNNSIKQCKELIDCIKEVEHQLLSIKNTSL